VNTTPPHYTAFRVVLVAVVVVVLVVALVVVLEPPVRDALADFLENS
jgi:hypothetical protein